jgi:hypothetical protein
MTLPADGASPESPDGTGRGGSLYAGRLAGLMGPAATVRLAQSEPHVASTRAPRATLRAGSSLNWTFSVQTKSKTPAGDMG